MNEQTRKKIRQIEKKIKEEFKDNRNSIILALIAILLLFVGYEYYHRYFYILKSPARVKQLILSYGDYSVLAFIGLQILQVIAFFIPGEIIQIAGGYIYGTLHGSILSLIGITMGSGIAYLVARVFGKPLVERMISEKQLKWVHKILSAGRKKNVVFLLYLIPGVPKDIIAYACGISEISFKDFLLYSTLGRIPGILVSAYFGNRALAEKKGPLIFIAIIMTTLFFIGVVKGEKIIRNLVKKDYEN